MSLYFTYINENINKTHWEFYVIKRKFVSEKYDIKPVISGM